MVCKVLLELAKAEGEVAEKMAALKVKEDELAEVMANLKGLQDELAATMKKKKRTKLNQTNKKNRK